jgi:hypothetical protein
VWRVGDTVGLVDVSNYLTQWLAKQCVCSDGDVVSARVVVVVDLATATHAVLTLVVFHILSIFEKSAQPNSGDAQIGVNASRRGNRRAQPFLRVLRGLQGATIFASSIAGKLQGATIFASFTGTAGRNHFCEFYCGETAGRNHFCALFVRDRRARPSCEESGSVVAEAGFPRLFQAAVATWSLPVKQDYHHLHTPLATGQPGAKMAAHRPDRGA